MTISRVAAQIQHQLFQSSSSPSNTHSLNMPSMKLMLVVLAAFVAYVTAQAGYAAPAYSPPAYPAGDYKPGYANGRVKIQVYRGPNKEYGKGYDKGYDGAFAPWGFYVTQPEDNKPYGKGY
uniref:Uncharacterized protein n=1 Tax=Daphnia galeata TaxID=27404 RepID=A0A8J2RSW1_9CRUS|nr:unnamed protein product [Daphnia galeata]